MIPHRSGFTLIEVLAAMGAFLLVFLTGSGGLMRLMQAQTANQQRAIAASAAMLLADWHSTVSAGSPHAFESDIYDAGNTHTIANPSTYTVGTLTNIRFRGATPDPAEHVYTFPLTTSIYPAAKVGTAGHFAQPAPTLPLKLDAYQQLVFTVTPSIQEPGSGMKFQVVTFWYGDPSSAISNGSDTFLFLASYLMPDQKP